MVNAEIYDELPKIKQTQALSLDSGGFLLYNLNYIIFYFYFMFY